eukprot:16434162-Heterocapsa_arctica.AAC.1
MKPGAAGTMRGLPLALCWSGHASFRAARPDFSSARASTAAWGDCGGLPFRRTKVSLINPHRQSDLQG